MIVNLITKEDLQEFRTELLEDLQNLFQIKISQQKLWLRSSEVKSTSENLLRNIAEATHQWNFILHPCRRDTILQFQRH